jgi:hypothetical protein
MNPQEQAYARLIELIVHIARDGFGIDVLNNHLYSSIFEAQLHRHHDRIAQFINHLVPHTPEQTQGGYSNAITANSGQYSTGSAAAGFSLDNRSCDTVHSGTCGSSVADQSHVITAANDNSPDKHTGRRKHNTNGR